MRILRNHWPALCLLLILLFVSAVRLRLLAMPLERDEGEYAYAGQLILEGVPPYRLVYNMKMPGIYAAYAAIMAVFGQTITGIHLGLLLVNLAAIVLLYLLARRLLGSHGAVAASATYALLSTSPRVLGFAAHATQFVVLAALGGMLLLLRAQERGRFAAFFWSGGLFGLAFLMKQPGGAFGLFGLSLLLWAAFRRRPRSWKTDTARIGLFSAGVLAPILLTALILWRVGVWPKFWFWTVTYAGIHAQNQSWSFGKADLTHYLATLGWDGLLWILAAMGLACLPRIKSGADGRFFLVTLLAFSVAAVCPTFYFSEHYFVLMLPALALLAGLAVGTVVELSASGTLMVFRYAAWILFLACWAAVAFSHRSVFLELSPDEACANTYFANAFEFYPVVGDYLRAHTPPNATLAVLGSEPQLMFYARRRSVTGYIYMYDLVQDHPFRAEMEREMRDEIEQGRPDYFVFVNIHLSWQSTDAKALDSIIEWMKNYTDNCYEPFGVVAFDSRQPFWGRDCLQRVPLSHRFITLFKRKPPPS
jgi:hypothetical protein